MRCVLLCVCPHHHQVQTVRLPKIVGIAHKAFDPECVRCVCLGVFCRRAVALSCRGIASPLYHAGGGFVGWSHPGWLRVLPFARGWGWFA